MSSILLKHIYRNVFSFCLAFLVATDRNPSLAQEQEKLPWETNFEIAKARSLKENKPLFIMMTAEWCGPCKVAERNTLTVKEVKDALGDFVWVKCYEDDKVNARYGYSGYPTFAFVEAKTDKVLLSESGTKPANAFLATVIKARKASNLPLSPYLQELAAKTFEVDKRKLESLIDSNDPKGLKAYLAPASEDAMRSDNYLLIKVYLPDDIDPLDVFVLAGDRIVPLTKTGLLCLTLNRKITDLVVRATSKGHTSEDSLVRFGKEQAIATQVINLRKMTAKESSSMYGIVRYPDGSPAQRVIVRLCDSAWVKTDEYGNYKLSELDRGNYDVRVEAPGCELQTSVQLRSGDEVRKDFDLLPQATIGIRWSLQREEGRLELTGDGVVEGEAYFGVGNSRFLLERGAKVRESFGSDFMIRNDLERLSKFISPEKLSRLQGKTEAPFFWLFDSSSNNGLHREDIPYESLDKVNNGNSDIPLNYFEFLRGDAVEVGQVFTVRCCNKNCYAKMEIIDVSPPFSSK